MVWIYPKILTEISVRELTLRGVHAPHAGEVAHILDMGHLLVVDGAQIQVVVGCQ